MATDRRNQPFGLHETGEQVMHMKDLRQEYHRSLCEQLLAHDSTGIPNNADKHSELSVALAKGIIAQLGSKVSNRRSSGQTAGKAFENLTAKYVENAFQKLQYIRPGNWQFFVGRRIEEFEQYEHLAVLAETLRVLAEFEGLLFEGRRRRLPGRATT